MPVLNGLHNAASSGRRREVGLLTSRSCNSAEEPGVFMLVGDDPEQRRTLRHALQTAFPAIRLIVASNVTEAVEMVLNGHFDAIVTDHLMADGTGFDLALQVACLVDDPVPPPIVLLTSADQGMTVANAMRVGIYDVVLKTNVTPASIHGAVNHALEKSRLQRANVEAHRALYLQAEALQRSNEVLSQFAAIASHDLKEPLRTIGGFTRLLERNYLDSVDQTGKEYIHFITDAVGRMSGLIDGLLAFARVGQSAEMDEVDLGEVMNDCIASLQHMIDQHEADISFGELPAVHGDRRLLTQLFQNLIANAVKFRGKEAPRIEIHATSEADHWRIFVHDNGIGIQPEQFERIFNIFTRLNSRDAYEGSGIGLSLCKRIAEFHQGRIFVESRRGGGSTFIVELPFAIDPACATGQVRDHDSLAISAFSRPARSSMLNDNQRQLAERDMTIDMQAEKPLPVETDSCRRMQEAASTEF